MVAEGRSVVFISHKLGEVLAIADRITVMRRGRVTASGVPAARGTKGDLARLSGGGVRGRRATRPDVARLMVGRRLLEVVDKPPFEPGEVVLAVQGVSAENDR